MRFLQWKSPDWWMVVLTALICLVTYFQWMAAKQAIALSAETFKVGNRAYVTVKKATVQAKIPAILNAPQPPGTVGVKLQPEGELQGLAPLMMLSIEFVNSGQTPAKDLTYTYIIGFLAEVTDAAIAVGVSNAKTGPSEFFPTGTGKNRMISQRTQASLHPRGLRFFSKTEMMCLPTKGYSSPSARSTIRTCSESKEEQDSVKCSLPIPTACIYVMFTIPLSRRRTSMDHRRKRRIDTTTSRPPRLIVRP